jgi:hypothetical protein
MTDPRRVPFVQRRNTAAAFRMQNTQQVNEKGLEYPQLKFVHEIRNEHFERIEVELREFI